MDHSETLRFNDAPTFRNVTILAPPEREFTREELNAIADTFVAEREQLPEELARVTILQTVGGRFAVEIVAKGSEAALHSRAARWSERIKSSVGDSPVGYEWSIDNPENVARVVVEQ